MTMLRTLGRWLASSLVLVFAVTGLAFAVEALDPGSAVHQLLGGQTSYTHAQYLAVERELGLNRPLPVQYWDWLTKLAFHGSFGTDLFSGGSISQALNGRLGASLSLIIGTILVAGVAGITIGVMAAVRRGRVARTLELATVLGFAVPNFWLALVMVELFAVKLRLLPATGYTSPTENPLEWLKSLILPVAALSAGTTAFIARQTRDSMLQVLSRDFIIGLRARGISRRSIIFRHALRNAAIPVVTVLGILFVGLLGGTVFIENVFAIPGLGQQAVSASATHDYPVIEGVAFYFTVIVIAVSLLVDLSYRALNPKTRSAR